MTASMPADDLTAARQARVVRWLLVFVLGGAGLYLLAAVWSGWSMVVQAFQRLGWAVLLAGAAFASLAYLLRFWRWHLALSALGSPVAAGFNLRVYLSGLALTTSPGKLGETLRSVLLASRGVPARRSLASFLADRLSDVLGVCLLGAGAGIWVGHGLNAAAMALAVIAAGSFALRFLVRQPSVARACRSALPRRLQGSAMLAGGTLEDWKHLWSPGRVLSFVGLAALAYGLQALVFGFFCHGLGLSLGLARVVEIFVNATLLGAASMVPGGLGTMEASLVVQLTGAGASTTDAVSVAIATRLATLWTGVAIGLISLMSLTPRRRRDPALD